MSTHDAHPSWCGRHHLCSFDRPGGEHRSNPVTVFAGNGRLVATRIRTREGRDRIEVRTVVDLPGDAVTARKVTSEFLARLHHALAATRTKGATP